MLGDSVRRRLPASRPWRRRGQGRSGGDGGGTRWRFWIPAVLSALALPFAIGYAFAVFVLFPPREVRGAAIEVPRLTGLELGRARADARAAGLGDVDVTRLPHSTRASGIVTAQSPLEGQELHAGVTVRVAVSAGPPQATIPDVVGFTAERAEGLLSRLGFGVLRIDEESSIEKGRVTEVDPLPGTVRELPSTVSLTVSTGPPPDTLFGADTLMPRSPRDTIVPGLPRDTLRPRPRTDTLGARDTTRGSRDTTQGSRDTLPPVLERLGDTGTRARGGEYRRMPGTRLEVPTARVRTSNLARRR